MLKKVALFIAIFTLPMILLAEELTIKKNAPTTYVVKKGDTLWDISGIFLNQPWLWPKLWRLNPDINNPHLIYPGEELRLVFDEKGQPMLVKGKPALKWSPRVRTQLKDQSPVTLLPLEVVAPYIKYDSLFTEEQLAHLPIVVASDESYKSSVDGFKLYINGDLSVGQVYAIYQKGALIIDPETEDELAYAVRLVGTAKAITSGNMRENLTATLFVREARSEIRSGDYVVPVNDEQLLPSYFTMQPAIDAIRGAIIQTSNGAREFGKLDVVMINRGETHSIKLGDVLKIKRQSQASNDDYEDYKLPEESLGEMMVFKVYQDISMALILGSTKPLRLEDVVTSL